MYLCICTQLYTFIYVTRSVKRGHNRTSLNLQYKALNTLDEILVYYWKNSVKFLTPLS